MATLAPDRPLMTISETAVALSISETTVRRLIGAGVLPAVRVSAGAIRVAPEELAGWISERMTESAVGGSSAEAVGRSSVDDPAQSATGPPVARRQ